MSPIPFDQLVAPLVRTLMRIGVVMVIATVVWFVIRFYAVNHFRAKGWPAKQVRAAADVVAHIGFGATLLIGFVLTFQGLIPR